MGLFPSIGLVFGQNSNFDWYFHTVQLAHRLSTVRNANAIMVLEDGKIIERGTHDELLAMKGRYYELYTGKKELD